MHIDDFTTKRNFDLQATWLMGVLCLSFLNISYIYGCLYNQALADIRSNGAGIIRLYCMGLPYINEQLP